MGPPGAGKGTLSQAIALEYNFEHISTGELLRSYSKRTCALAKKIRKILQAGGYASDEDMIQILKESLDQIPEGTNVLLDGFPRTLAQCEALSECGIELTYVFSLLVPEYDLMGRILGRYACSECGEIYHETNKSAPEDGCLECGSLDFTRRQDDTPELFQRRLDKHKENYAPMADFFARKGVLHHIGASGTLENSLKQFSHVFE